MQRFVNDVDPEHKFWKLSSVRQVLDFIYPPLCLSCKERCETKFLCLDCWKLCALVNPTERCRYCFDELDRSGEFCSTCSRQQRLPVDFAYVFDPESPARFLGMEAVDAMAGFALVQWSQLQWPVPGVVVAMPGSEPIGKAFAQLLDVPFAKALAADFSYVEDRLDEDVDILLFSGESSRRDLLKGAFALGEAFPKRVYILSLFVYVDCIA